MTLITLENVERSFGDLTILADVNLQVGETDRIGVVGDNGAGKSTLVKTMAGLEPPDRGVRRTRRGLRVGYGSQIPKLPEGTTVLQAVLGSLDEINAMERRLRELESTLESDPNNAAVHDEYDRIHVAFEAAGGWDRERVARRTLHGLGFAETELGRAVDVLSGGQKARVVLATLMLTPAECLILDEPTNHLDLAGIEFLEDYVRERPGAVIVVSHDRRFLDATATAIVEVEDTKVTRWRGNWSSFREQKALAYKTALREYEKQQEHIAKEMDYIRRNMGSRMTDQAKGRLKRLQRLTVLSRPKADRRGLRLKLGTSRGHEGQPILEFQQVRFDHPGHPVFKNVGFRLLAGEVLGIVGPNGAGKTTLLDLMAGSLTPTAGTIRRPARAAPGYFGQEIEELPEDMTVLRAIAQKAPTRTEGEWRSFLALFLFFEDDVDKTVGTLSGGERRRLSLARLLLAGFDFLLMDEPTNHLDIAAREGLESALESYNGGVAVVSHDREFLSRVADRILWVGDGTARVFDNGFEELQRWLAEQRATERAEAQAEKAKARKEADKGADKPALRAGQIRNPMEFERLEKKIFEKEEQLATLRAELGQPDAWKNAERLKELKQQEDAIADDLKALYERWENWQ